MPSSSPLLAFQALASGLVALFLLVVWASAGGGELWPLWVWHELAVALALHYALRRALVRPSAYRVHVALTAVAAGTVLSTWALFTGGWWVVWPLLGLALALALHEPVRRLLRHGALAVHAAASALAFGITAVVWLLTGADGTWIVWPALGLGGALATHAVCREHATLVREWSSRA
jgi:hypothetical protein